ncbi:MAG: glycosyltransferase family 2 protein [Bacteroidetes bacterium]|nr:glycosyltransferase family 2 protein [Bacteroidota bacterium]
MRYEDIWTLIPAYNEAGMIQEVIRDLKEAGFSNVLIVDDGSTDDTYSLALNAGARVLKHVVNRGAGAAVQTGLQYAKQQNWKYLAMMDADGQHAASDIKIMYDAMVEADLDLVVGSRFMNLDNEIPTSRRFFNRIGNLMTNLSCKGHYTDSQSGLRFLNNRALQVLELHIDGFGFCSEMLYQAELDGLKIGEIPAQVQYTAYSMGKGQDFEAGITTALMYLRRIFF